jgi:Na+-transporting methylmalonyl-CoA/oxaloacetate decarboxylase gamma subunit
MKTIKDLLLALINATMILLIILVVAGIYLMWQVEHVTDFVHDEIAPQEEKLERIATAVESIDEQLKTAGETSDLTGLRTDIAALRGEIEEATDRIDAMSNLTAAQSVTQLGRILAAAMAQSGAAEAGAP